MNDFCMGILMKSDTGIRIVSRMGRKQVVSSRQSSAGSKQARLFSLCLLISNFILVSCVGNQATFQASKLEDKTKAQFQPAPGARAAKFIFTDSASGSFSPPAPGGNLIHPAIRVFNADGSLLSSGGPTGSGWPLWITKVEIGVSGSANPSAPNGDCARFATATESATKCDFSGSGLPQNFNQLCGAPSSIFRISEYDCVSSAGTLDGNGGPTDGVYVRIGLNRAALADFENFSLTIEYSASSLRPAPADPTQCFTASGIFNPANPNCSDFAWQLYLKQATNSVVQPFLLLFPPFTGSVNPTTLTSGTSVHSRQITLPVAADSSITEIQLSRTRGMPVSAQYTATCDDPSSPGANSPLCVGLILRSLTLFRM